MSLPAQTPLYVRLPPEQASRLDRAADALGAAKKDLVAALIAEHVDPDSSAGLERLRGLGGRDPIGRTLATGHHAFRPQEAPEVLTVAQAAALLQVGEDAVLALADAGKLPGRRIGEQWRFSRAALVAWLAGGG